MGNAGTKIKRGFEDVGKTIKTTVLHENKQFENTGERLSRAATVSKLALEHPGKLKWAKVRSRFGISGIPIGSILEGVEVALTYS